MGIYSNLAVKTVQENGLAVDNTNAAGLLETAVALAIAEQSMFDALIELDFREAYVQKGVTILTEADQEQVKESKIRNLWEGFKKIVEKVKNAVVSAVNKFFAKVEQLVGADAKLVKRFGDINPEAVVGFDKEITVVKNWDVEYDGEVLQDGRAKIDAIGSAGDIDAVNDAVNALIEFAEAQDKIIKESGVDRTLQKVKGQDADVAEISKKMAAGFKDMMAGIKKEKDTVLKDLEASKKTVETTLKEAKKSKNDLEIAKLNGQIKGYSRLMRVMTKEFNFRLTVARKYIGVTRAAYVALGNYASSGKAMKESTDMLVEASNIMVDRIFES